MITLFLVTIALHGLVFTWAMCRAAHNSDEAMHHALREARARDQQPATFNLQP
jgi:hypothetical protein